MSGFKNIGVKEYFRRYGYKYGLIRGMFMALPIHYISDYENKKLLYYQHVSEKIKREFSRKSSIIPEGLEFPKLEINNPIWVYWKQGEYEAPEIVKRCISSIKENVRGTVIVLDEGNLEEYIKLPKYVEKKAMVGNISAAHFSDLIRFSLLEHYGGTWIDATVLLTEKIPEYITESEIFAYRDSLGTINNAALAAVWLLHSKPHNAVIEKVRNYSFAYWRNHQYIQEYLFSNIVLTIALEEYGENFERMPYASSEYSTLLFKNIDASFDYTLYEHLLELSCVHKLSYKLEESVFLNKNNFYHYLVKNGN